MARKPKHVVPEDGCLPRIADEQLVRMLRSPGAVYVRGPKGCGKTATGKHQAASQVFMQDSDRSKILLAFADSKPSSSEPLHGSCRQRDPA